MHRHEQLLQPLVRKQQQYRQESVLYSQLLLMLNSTKQLSLKVINVLLIY